MKSLYLLALFVSAAAPLSGAVIYGYKSEPFFYTYSSSPISTSATIVTGHRVDTFRADTSLGIRMDVTDWASAANEASVLRNETVTLFPPGPIQPTYVFVFDWTISGDYSLGAQSQGSFAGSVVVGATGTTPGGLIGGTVIPETTPMNAFYQTDTGTSGTFSRSTTVQVPIPVTGSVTLGFVLWVSAQNNGYVNVLNSLHFGGARVIDTATGQTVQGVTFGSESGFDWTTPVPSSAVPEPSTGLLALSLGSAILLARRRG